MEHMLATKVIEFNTPTIDCVPEKHDKAGQCGVFAPYFPNIGMTSPKSV